MPHPQIRLSNDGRRLLLYNYPNALPPRRLVFTANEIPEIKGLIQKTLRELELRDLSSTDIAEITEHIGSTLLYPNSSLTSLSFKGTPLTNGAITPIAHGLMAGAPITSLNLAGTKLNSQGIHDLAEGLRSSDITSLDLSHNSISYADMEILAPALATCSQLTYLNLTNTEITDEAIGTLARAFAEHSPNRHPLKELTLTGNAIATARHIRALAEQCPSLTTLDLEDNPLPRAVLLKTHPANRPLSAHLLPEDRNPSGRNRLTLDSPRQNTTELRPGLTCNLGVDVQCLALYNPELREMTLASAGIYSIRNAFRTHPTKLNSLAILGKYLSETQIEDLPSLSGIGAITKVTVKELPDDPLEREKIATALSKMVDGSHSITTLNISHQPGLGQSKESIEPFLRFHNNTSLKHVLLRNIDLSPAGIETLNATLFDHAPLPQRLDFSKNTFGDQGAEELVPILGKYESNNNGLYGLNLSATGITSLGMHSLSSALRDQKGLRVLDFSFNAIGDGGIEALAPVVQNNKELASLNLHTTGMTLAGVERLSDALAGHTRLKFLEIYNNPGIGDDGIRALGRVFEHNPNISQLNLSNTGMTPIGLESLSSALKENRRLTRLDFSNNPIGDDGIMAIYTILKNNPNISHLNLSNTGITDKGIQALAPVLANHPNLTHLVITKNPASLKSISGLLDSNPFITECQYRDPDSLVQPIDEWAEVVISPEEKNIRKYLDRNIAISNPKSDEHIQACVDFLTTYNKDDIKPLQALALPETLKQGFADFLLKEWKNIGQEGRTPCFSLGLLLAAYANEKSKENTNDLLPPSFSNTQRPAQQAGL